MLWLANEGGQLQLTLINVARQWGDSRAIMRRRWCPSPGTLRPHLTHPPLGRSDIPAPDQGTITPSSKRSCVVLLHRNDAAAAAHLRDLALRVKDEVYLSA